MVKEDSASSLDLWLYRRRKLWRRANGTWISILLIASVLFPLSTVFMRVLGGWRGIMVDVVPYLAYTMLAVMLVSMLAAQLELSILRFNQDIVLTSGNIELQRTIHAHARRAAYFWLGFCILLPQVVINLALAGSWQAPLKSFYQLLMWSTGVAALAEFMGLQTLGSPRSGIVIRVMWTLLAALALVTLVATLTEGMSRLYYAQESVSQREVIRGWFSSLVLPGILGGIAFTLHGAARSVASAGKPVHTSALTAD